VNLDIVLAFNTGIKSYLSSTLEFHALDKKQISIILHVKEGMSC